MITVQDVVMEFDLNRGKVRSLKERLFSQNKIGKEMFRALNGVSFHVNQGEILGIIGGNGAGKSTLLKVTAGIMKPTSGQVKVRGTIAPMIELGTGFDFELSALENIYLSGAVLGYSKRFIHKCVPEVFDFSELWEFKDVPIKYFSSGMVARLAFAISTIVTPDVLIVDEILSVGDTAFQKKSMERMKNLMHGRTTVVYVSHDIDSIQELCTHVIWLDKGKIKQYGIAEDVCLNYLKSI